MTRTGITTLFLFISGHLLTAQPFERAISPEEVVVRSASGERLANPFSGGLDLTRVGIWDNDRDGLLDLWTFNLGGEFRRYENRGDFHFVRDNSLDLGDLPIRSWFRFADITGDGAPELFTSGERSEVMQLTNRGSIRPDFALPDTVRREDGTPIYTEQLTVPTFVDIDNDGDRDLFAGNVDGTITFYENMGSAENPSFLFRTNRYESLIVISPVSTRKGDPPVATIQHGASVLDFVDTDNDGDLDIYFGDFFTKGLLHFENRGTPERADFDTLWVDSAFAPGGNIVESAGFNQAASGDVDRDGDDDVVVSSLLASALAIPLEIYENRGSSESPRMERIGPNPTGEIDVGRRAAPTFISDSERKGLLIGAEDGSISWYEMVREGESDLLQEQRRYPLNGLSSSIPAAGDIDGDGVAEVVVGKSDALDGTTMRLYRFDGDNFVRVPWQLDTTFNIIRSGASPTLVDIDGDGDLDLFSGGRNGRFGFFRNTGTPTAPLFTVETPPSPFDTLDLGSYSSPRFLDLDGDSDLDVAVGARSLVAGSLDSIHFYLNEGGTFRPDDAYRPILAGQYPVPLPIVTDGRPVLMVGTGPGGILYFYRGERSSVEDGDRLPVVDELDLTGVWRDLAAPVFEY